ncbi:MAG: HK97 gp10 family phage protein [Oscillibacter sp.]|nr:HK97 gp10 family phage protein [Oscillibacter sp.]
MAEFHFSGVDELELSLREIEELPEEVVDEMLEAQADVLIDEIQNRGEAYGVMAPGSGKMLRSIKKGRPKRGKNGTRQIVVSPRGTRKRGKEGKKTSNAEIAFLNNYGTRHQQARPFWSDAEKTSEKSMEKAAAEVHDKWLNSKGL